MIGFLPAPSSLGLTWYLMILALALPMPVAAQSEQPKSVKWQGIETFENAYTYSGRTSAHLGNVNEYNHHITVFFTYVEETDAQGIRKFTSRKIRWTAEGKAVATGFTSTTCNGSGALELVGLSDEDLYEKLKIPCTSNDKGILVGSFTKPPDRIRPPKIVDWEKVRNNCAYSEERTAPSGERYTYTVRVSPGCNCDLKPPKKTANPPQKPKPPAKEPGPESKSPSQQWWWLPFQGLWGIIPDPSPPGFDPLNVDLGPGAVEGGMATGKKLKATEVLDKTGDTGEYHRIKNMCTKDFMNEFGNKKAKESKK